MEWWSHWFKAEENLQRMCHSRAIVMPLLSVFFACGQKSEGTLSWVEICSNSTLNFLPIKTLKKKTESTIHPLDANLLLKGCHGLWIQSSDISFCCSWKGHKTLLQDEYQAKSCYSTSWWLPYVIPSTNKFRASSISLPTKHKDCVCHFSVSEEQNDAVRA